MQIEELTGLNKDHVTLTEAALLNLNKAYCRESGVRNLKKHIEKIYRKVAYKVRLYTATFKKVFKNYSLTGCA